MSFKVSIEATLAVVEGSPFSVCIYKLSQFIQEPSLNFSVLFPLVIWEHPPCATGELRERCDVTVPGNRKAWAACLGSLRVPFGSAYV